MLTLSAVPNACTRASVPIGEPRDTALRLRAALGTDDPAVVFVFSSPTIDRPAFAAALQETFAGGPVVGCTTAGEIGPGGMVEGTVVACALSRGSFTVVHEGIHDVRTLAAPEAQRIVGRLVGRLACVGRPPTAENTFAVLLVDGLSIAEELSASALSNALGEVPLVGGSAGDGLCFGQTHVFCDGQALPHGAVLVLVQTSLPFRVFKTQHFVPGERRLVVTGAECSRRNVHEIDGEVAAEQFARMVGVPVAELSPTVFATHPLVVRVGGSDYVRSIQKVEPDGSLTFYCAIEEGIVLRDARGVDLVHNLEAALDELRRAVGPPQLTIAFDCILRRLECDRSRLSDTVGRLMDAANVVGFSTYGEQFHGMHVNQTLTGVAIGSHR